MIVGTAGPRKFVGRYGEAAVAENAENGGQLPVFSAEVLTAVRANER